MRIPDLLLLLWWKMKIFSNHLVARSMSQFASQLLNFKTLFWWSNLKDKSGKNNSCYFRPFFDILRRLNRANHFVSSARYHRQKSIVRIQDKRSCFHRPFHRFCIFPAKKYRKMSHLDSVNIIRSVVKTLDVYLDLTREKFNRAIKAGSWWIAFVFQNERSVPHGENGGFQVKLAFYCWKRNPHF